MDLPVKEIIIKDFKTVYPDFVDFQSNIVDRVVAIDGSDYTNNDKMFSKWEEIYNVLMNQYGERLLRYEVVEFENYLVNTLLAQLPNMYAKQMLLVDNQLTKLKGKMGNISKIRNRSINSSQPTTEVLDVDQLELRNVGADQANVNEFETELNPVQQAITFASAKIRNALFELVGSLDVLFVSMVNENSLRAGNTPILRFETYEEVVTRVLASIPIKMSSINYYDDANKFMVDAINGGIGYTNGVEPNSFDILVKDANNLVRIPSEINVDAKINAVKALITANANEITQLKRKGTYKGTYDTVDKINALNGITGDSAVLKTAKDGGGFTYIEYIYDLDGNGTWVETGSESDAHPAVQVEHKLKYILKTASYVAPADPNGIGSINVESVEFKDIIEHQMVELEIDMKALKPIDNSQVYIITDADKGEFLRLAFKNGDVASWDEVKDKIYDHNMLVEKEGQYVFIRGWLLKGKANLPEEYTLDEALAKDWTGYNDKTFIVTYHLNGQTREFNDTYKPLSASSHVLNLIRNKLGIGNDYQQIATYRFIIHNGAIQSFDSYKSTLHADKTKDRTSYADYKTTQTVVKIKVVN